MCLLFKGEETEKTMGGEVKRALRGTLGCTEQHTPVVELLLITQLAFAANYAFRWYHSGISSTVNVYGEIHCTTHLRFSLLI